MVPETKVYFGLVQWLFPVILAAWQVEIRRITAGRSAPQMFVRPPISIEKAGCGGAHLWSQLCGKQE
jgi:hypothetical protein